MSRRHLNQTQRWFIWNHQLIQHARSVISVVLLNYVMSTMLSLSLTVHSHHHSSWSHLNWVLTLLCIQSQSTLMVMVMSLVVYQVARALMITIKWCCTERMLVHWWVQWMLSCVQEDWDHCQWEWEFIWRMVSKLPNSWKAIQRSRRSITHGLIHLRVMKLQRSKCQDAVQHSHLRWNHLNLQRTWWSTWRYVHWLYHWVVWIHWLNIQLQWPMLLYLRRWWESKVLHQNWSESL